MSKLMQMLDEQQNELNEEHAHTQHNVELTTLALSMRHWGKRNALRRVPPNLRLNCCTTWPPELHAKLAAVLPYWDCALFEDIAEKNPVDSRAANITVTTLMLRPRGVCAISPIILHSRLVPFDSMGKVRRQEYVSLQLGMEVLLLFRYAVGEKATADAGMTDTIAKHIKEDSRAKVLHSEFTDAPSNVESIFECHALHSEEPYRRTWRVQDYNGLDASHGELDILRKVPHAVDEICAVLHLPPNVEKPPPAKHLSLRAFFQSLCDLFPAAIRLSHLWEEVVSVSSADMRAAELPKQVVTKRL